MIVLYLPFRNEVPPEHKDYICPLTVEDAAARGHIWTATRGADGTWTDYTVSHLRGVLNYTQSLTRLLNYYQARALTEGDTSPIKYMTAHGARTIKQALWFWAIRNRACVDAHLDPNRVQLLDVYNFFYTHTYSTMSERENFGTAVVNQCTGFASVPALFKMLVEEDIYV